MFKIDPRLHTWLYGLLIFLLLGTGAFYVLNEIESITDDVREIFIIGYTFVFLLGVIIYQGVRIGHKAKDLAAHMTSDLSSSKELFLNLFRNSPIPYVLIKRSGEITLANTAAIRLFSVAQDELNGKNVFNLITAEAGDDKGANRIDFITCLLYTSPSPRDRTRSRMPSSA